MPGNPTFFFLSTRSHRGVLYMNSFKADGVFWRTPEVFEVFGFEAGSFFGWESGRGWVEVSQWSVRNPDKSMLPQANRIRLA